MIDTFQFFVWPPDSDLHESFPFGPAPADSPRARRLLCLVAEARAAGVPTRVLFALLLDWARVLGQHAQGDRWRDALARAVNVLETALGADAVSSHILQRAFEPMDVADADELDDTPTLRVARLLGSHFGELISRGVEADPETAWDAAVVSLSAIEEVVQPNELETVIGECARRAHERLFRRADVADL